MAKFSTLKIFTDGGSRGNPGVAGIGVHAVDDQGSVVYEYSEYLGETTNNVAEYKGLLHALTWLSGFEKDNQVEKAEFYMDSKLVVEQINKVWQIKQEHLADLAKLVWAQKAVIKTPLTLTHVRREKNKEADLLANAAMDSARV